MLPDTYRMPFSGIFALLLLLTGCTGGAENAAQTETTREKSAPIPQYTPLVVDSSQLQVLQPGLQVYMVHRGSGKLPAVGDEVIVHYHGYLPGQPDRPFDSSYLKGEPYNVQGIGRGQVILGWDKAIPTLPVGSKAVLIIAPELAYGDRQAGSIPPGSTLIFDVEILDTHPLPGSR